MQFFIGLMIMAIGVSMVVKTDSWLGFLGRNDWAEQKLGPGGSRLLYKIIGLFFCFFGILGITGLLNGFMTTTLGAIFGPREQP